ncbi:flagellar hook-length control protein FliK [Sinanaerobacter chloroacetimidivorans]|uniref:Flagellar hook-length control protein FliK n=1 Tax=Sinanaerobacter chloroacetimidivorans TaxID=2818044 RepID=A0A8J8B0E9_9FIRM|nr:flagellar hook-length control protein FliK [Sinanaerobacter chloroacetimidivorans]MBR0597533.1 flagellar hook-length control protein FliK [Sinanaerobacter chloroacetimidivorans]
MEAGINFNLISGINNSTTASNQTVSTPSGEAGSGSVFQQMISQLLGQGTKAAGLQSLFGAQQNPEEETMDSDMLLKMLFSGNLSFIESAGQTETENLSDQQVHDTTGQDSENAFFTDGFDTMQNNMAAILYSMQNSTRNMAVQYVSDNLSMKGNLPEGVNVESVTAAGSAALVNGTEADQGIFQARNFGPEQMMQGSGDSQFGSGMTGEIFPTGSEEMLNGQERKLTDSGLDQQTLPNFENLDEADQLTKKWTSGFAENAQGTAVPAAGISEITQQGVQGTQASEPYSQISSEIMNHLDAKAPVEFKMQLEPENLGLIDIKLKLNEGKLIIDIMAANAKTQSLLSGQVDKLVQNLGLQNVRIESVQVSQQMNQQNTDGQNYQNQAFAMNSTMDFSQRKQQEQFGNQTDFIRGYETPTEEPGVVEALEGNQGVQGYYQRMNYIV